MLTAEVFLSFFSCFSEISDCRFLVMDYTIAFLEYKKLGDLNDSSGVWLIELYMFSLEANDSRN